MTALGDKIARHRKRCGLTMSLTDIFKTIAAARGPGYLGVRVVFLVAIAILCAAHLAGLT